MYFSLKFAAPWSEKHSWNIASETKQFLKAKLKIVVKEEQPENISPIFFTSEVWKFDRSSVVKLLQSLNIAYISVTSDVSKLERSRVVKDEHSLNILHIFVT